MEGEIPEMEAADSVQPSPEATPRRRGRGNSGQVPIVVGSYVTKNFADGSGTLLGKIVSGGIGRYFAAVYEDGRREELEIYEIRRILLPADDTSTEADEKEKLALRKKKLEVILSEGTPSTRSSRRKVDSLARPSASVRADRRRGGREVSTSVVQGEDVDSSTDSSETVALPSDVPPLNPLTPQLHVPSQALALPPSSGSIGVSEESVGCLLSVYSFLRAFSLPLFLSPFGLGDFVGSLNCTLQNSLLDSIHVSLMRALRRHLDVLSSEGSQPASRCLRCLNWAMLDTLTWPVYVLEYLYMTGHIRGPEWKEFQYGRSEEEEYYSLPAATKLKILQILCDAVLDCGELRNELDLRKEADEEGEYAAGEGAANDRAGEESTSKNADLPEDGNSDECRICGMDGTLICCDGCPSAYHSRCIGLGKASLPDGSWFCPECAFAKIGGGIRGAEMFGIDLYGRAFVGTCNYLLILNASSTAEPVSRYYDRDDLGKVLKFLCSAEDYSPLYADICKEISRYWAIPMDEYCAQTAAAILQNGNPPQGVESQGFSAAKMRQDSGRASMSNVTQIALEHSTTLPNMKGDLAAGVMVSKKGPKNQADDWSGTETFVNRSAGKLCSNIDGLTAAVTENQSSSICADSVNLQITEVVLPQRIDQDSDLLSSRSFSQPTGLTDLVQQRFSEKSTMLGDFASSVTIGTIAAFRDDADSRISSLTEGSQPINLNSVIGQRSALSWTAFHPQAYVNQYVLGEVAASAAADLVTLDSDECKYYKLGTNASSLNVRRRKAASATTAMQLKAFSKASTRFVWTNVERRFIEGLRERCGWCISCKGAAVNKKGCLLNVALSHAGKTGLIRGHAGIRPPVKIYEKSHISAIATHILNMVGHLCGLLVGPLADPTYKKRWCASVRDASLCRMLRPLLLELEKSIRSITFSAEWFKPIDDGLIDHLVGRGALMPMQKRGPGRPKKKLPPAETAPAAIMESLKETSWWRGVRLSRILFQKGCLPRCLAKKAARQGGVKCISGVNYSGNSHNPRTQQLAWRAAVEMSMSASQLALQVRWLDAHIRWKDLVRPEHMPPEMARGMESDAFAFKNAVICEVQVSVGSKTRYAVVFDNQKHLPSRVMKNILETETDSTHEGAKEKLWFAEDNVPLYLIKEHEERSQKEGGVSMAHHHHHHRKEVFQRYSSMREIQLQQLQAFRRDIFSYLLSREDNSITCSCASCPHSLLIREAVRCSACRGYCHEACFFTPTSTSAYPERDPLCKQCHIVLSSPATAKNGEHLKNNFSSTNTNAQLPHSSTKIISLSGGCVGGFAALHPAPVVDADLTRQPKVQRAIVEASCVSETRGRVHGSGDLQVSHGLVWRSRKNGDGGEQFRLRHVIPKGGDSTMRRPICVLCAKDYDPSAMYVRCERCLSWVHAEAVLLEEDRARKLVGFKCGKCRRKSSPRCPYEDDYPDSFHRRKKNINKPTNTFDERSSNGVVVHSVSSPQQQQPLFLLPEPATADVKAEEHSAAGQKMLHKDADASMNMNAGMDLRMSSIINMSMNTGIDMDFDLDIDLDMDMDVDVDVESEPPQTYFSFTELLEAPDDSHLDAQLEDFRLSLIPSCDSPAKPVCESCGAAFLPWAAAGGASTASSWKCAACRDWV